MGRVCAMLGPVCFRLCLCPPCFCHHLRPFLMRHALRHRQYRLRHLRQTAVRKSGSAWTTSLKTGKEQEEAQVEVY